MRLLVLFFMLCWPQIGFASIQTYQGDEFLSEPENRVVELICNSAVEIPIKELQNHSQRLWQIYISKQICSANLRSFSEPLWRPYYKPEFYFGSDNSLMRGWFIMWLPCIDLIPVCM